MVITSFLEKLTNLDLDQDEKEDKEEEPRSADLLKINLETKLLNCHTQGSHHLKKSGIL